MAFRPRQPRARSSDRASVAPDTGHPPQTEATSGRRRRRTEHAAPPAIRIDIDPAISAGYIHDRYDLLVRGRVATGVPVEEIAIRLDDAVIGRVQFGRPDQVPQNSAADDGTGIQQVFHINLPLRRAEAHRMCTCIVAARTQNGDTHEQSFDLSVDPSSTVPVTVASGPTLSAQSYAHVRPPVVLYVERAALDEAGQLLVHGWAVSLTAIVAVQVFLDEARIGAAQLGGQRDDVGSAFPAYQNARLSGFTLSQRIDATPANVSTVRVQAISMNGFLHEAVLPVERVHVLAPSAPLEAAPSEPMPPILPMLQQPTYRLVTGFSIGPDLPPLAAPPTAPSFARDPRRDIRFFCDEMDLDADGRLSVVGWAVCAVGISAIVVHLDDQEMGEAELGFPRTDVGDEYRHIPMARYAGFRFARSLGDVRDGEHRIRVVLRNGLDDTRDEVRTVLIERAPPPPPPPPPAQFRLEIDTPTVVTGAMVGHRTADHRRMGAGPLGDHRHRGAA